MVPRHPGGSRVEDDLDGGSSDSCRPVLLCRLFVAPFDEESIHDSVLPSDDVTNGLHSIGPKDFRCAAESGGPTLWPSADIARLNRDGRVLQNALDLPRIRVRRERETALEWNHPHRGRFRRSILSERHKRDVAGVFQFLDHDEKYAVPTHRSRLIRGSAI